MKFIIFSTKIDVNSQQKFGIIFQFLNKKETKLTSPAYFNQYFRNDGKHILQSVHMMKQSLIIIFFLLKMVSIHG